MRIGIYNRWLATLGGGEKYVLTIAEKLSQDHQVEVISHSKVDKHLAGKRLNVDLSQVEFVILPDRVAMDMAPITAQYDFFINGSYLDFFPCYAPKSASIIYFPFQLGRNSSFRGKLKGLLRRIFNIPQVMISPQAFVLSRESQGWIVDADFKLHLPAKQFPYKLDFDLGFTVSELPGAKIYVNGQLVNKLTNEDRGSETHVQLTIPVKASLDYHEVVISPDSNDVRWDGLPRIEVLNLGLDITLNCIYSQWFQKGLNELGVYLEYVPPGSAVIQYLDTYQSIWTISEYVQRWTWHYWKRASEILYPPVNVEGFWVGEKTKKIINVGRFFAGQHNKKHHAMLMAFKQMVDKGLTGYTLYLAGGTTPGDEHKKYLESLFEQAQGYPVVILPDIPYPELAELYVSSEIYWHASGYEEDERREPEKSEHFGITTVEGMAAGCVPIVINKGGQPEIVQHGKNGYLWNTLDELQEFTLSVINDEKKREKLSAEALKSSLKFDTHHFNDRLQNLIAQLDSV